MSIAPLGIESEALDAVADLLAQATAWHAWSGKTYDSSKLDKGVNVFQEDIPDPDTDSPPPRPFAVVKVAQNFEIGGTRGSHISGDYEVYFEANISDKCAPPNSGQASDGREPILRWREFMNQVGVVLEEMETKSHGGGFMVVRRIRRIEVPRHSDPDVESDNYYTVKYVLTCGTGS